MTKLEERFLHLAEILVALAGSPIPSQQFQTLADYAGFILTYDYLGLALRSPAADGYVVHSLSGTVADAITPRLFKLDEGIVGRVLTQNKAFMTADFTLPDVPQTTDLEGVCARFGLRAALVVPVRQGIDPIGALLFLAKPPVVFADDDQQLANLLAAGLSSSLETARIYQTLSDEHSTLAAVFGSTKEAVLVVNEAGIVLLANPAVKPMLGLDETAVVGQPLADVGLDGDILQLFDRLSSEKEEVMLPDGRVAEVSLVPVRSVYGEAIGWAAVFYDVTFFKELGQMKSDFVNTVSHDLKNSISIIRIATDLMERVGDLNEQQMDLRQRILSTTICMSELISDLLDRGKIEAGVGQQKELLDLVILVRVVVFDLRTSWEAKEQEVVLSAPEELMMMADKKQFRQVLLTLIGNAVKYTPETKKIWVIITSETNKIMIQVQDQGIGIPAADLPYVFDKFYRVVNFETKDVKGTGLGLAITKNIVEAHNGRISVTSVPNVGSTFIITLPQ